MIALVVILNYLGAIHLWQPQNDQFCDIPTPSIHDNEQ